MNLAIRRNDRFPSLLSDFFGSSLLDKDFFDFDNGFFTSRLGANVPMANITETSKEYVLELAAPGLERKDFNVEVDNHILKISAQKEEEKKEKEGEYSRREYSFNSFSRSFALPSDVKEGSIDAKYENGVLRIAIPKVKETPVKPVMKVAVS